MMTALLVGQVDMIAPLLAQDRPTPELNLRIAYNVFAPDSAKEDNYEVVVVRPDGSEARNITRDPDVAWTYHAAGDRLFFISDRDTCDRCYFLYETDAHGRSPRKVSDLRLEDSWMDSRHNGDELIVSGRLDKAVRFQLFLLDTRTGGYRQLTTDTAARFGDPCFSPDGRFVAFSYKANRRDRNTHEELFIADADMGGMRQLTHYPADNVSATGFGYKAGAPRWHPSGAFISYVSQQDGTNGIFTVAPDGGPSRRITDPSFEAGWHDWSPDGDWLAYDRSEPGGRIFAIWIRHVPTGREFRVSPDTWRVSQAPVFVRSTD